MKAFANAVAAPSRKQEPQTDGAAAAKATDDAGKEKALEPLGSKAFPVLPELVGATGFEPATPRPPGRGLPAKLLKIFDHEKRTQDEKVPDSPPTSTRSSTHDDPVDT
ncbi:hypothetical protein [Azospirillum oryzae]|uniref:hypothetical protein n=1 Tax=Azospirillum oryzae TaxID=286727 RepID=UPI0011785E2E|nr:hypothetical protein [Azospirillum oryzae]